MSYDLMVFDASVAPKERDEFMQWYRKETKWEEDHNYQEHTVASPKLQSWYMEMIKEFPPMNGSLASEDFDDPKVTDHCIGKNVIYSAFAWSVSEEAFPAMRDLAIKHEVGFFDVSSENGEILFPQNPKKWWQFWRGT